MCRTTAIALGIVLALAAPYGSANRLGRVTSRLILVFDQRPEGWTVKATLRPILNTDAIPAWAIAGTMRCHRSRCPGGRARLAGTVGPRGEVFAVQATFPSGVRCAFTGRLGDPDATNGYRCTDPTGTILFEDTFHVGGCRCLDRARDPAIGFCATDPCPF